MLVFFLGVAPNSDMHEQVTPGVFAQANSEARFYEEPDMKTDLNHSQQVHARAHRHAGSAAPDAVSLASITRYTCPMHPEMVRHAPGRCPKCGMTLTPIFEAIARAAMALRSLSVVTNALRLNRV